MQWCKGEKDYKAKTYFVESAQSPYNSWRYFWSHSSKASDEKCCLSRYESLFKKATISFWVRKEPDIPDAPVLLISSSTHLLIMSNMQRSTLASIPFSESKVFRIWVTDLLQSGISMTVSSISSKTDFILHMTDPTSALWREEVTAESESARGPWKWREKILE